MIALLLDFRGIARKRDSQPRPLQGRRGPNAAIVPFRRVTRQLVWLSLVLFLAGHLRSDAIVFFATADPDHNTTAPPGELASSGWELQGLWGAYLGTPIAPNYFIAAQHIGGAIGDKFRLNDLDYTTIGFFDDPSSDLRIWQISGQFKNYAGLYAGSDEAGKYLIAFGRGTQRGEEVRVGGLLGSQLKGWKWGATDGRKRWGENRVATIYNHPQVGELLRATFDAQGEPNEAHASIGDSSGGIFIKEGNSWKLAGVSYGVDGPYNLTDSGEGFQAAIFDDGGLYRRGDGTWTQTPDLPLNQAGAFYASRISSRLSWIQNILSRPTPVPVPATVPVLQSADSSGGAYRDEGSAMVDQSARTISLPLPGGVRFYRISAPDQLRISGVRIQNGRLVLGYE
jgi:hypothetical protein